MAKRKKMLIWVGVAAAAVVAYFLLRKKPAVATTPGGGDSYAPPRDDDGLLRPAPGWVLMNGPDGKRHWMPPYANI